MSKVLLVLLLLEISVHPSNQDGVVYTVVWNPARHLSGVHNNVTNNICLNDTIANNCLNGTTSKNCINDNIGKNCLDDTVCKNCLNDTIRKLCLNDTISKSFLNDTFDKTCLNDTIDKICLNETINKNCLSDVIDKNCLNNTISKNCLNNFISNDSIANSAPILSGGELLGPQEYRKEMKSIVAKMCGLKRMCNTSGLDHAQYSSQFNCSWCEMCRCDIETCRLYGDCCLDLMFDDVIRTMTDGNVLNPSRNKTSYGDCYDLRLSKSTMEFSYIHKEKLVSTCPQLFDDLDIVDKCDKGNSIYNDLDPTAKAENMEDLRPVTSILTNVSYRNEACAQCHGENIDFLISWNLNVKCRAGVTSKNPGLTQLQTLQHFLGKKDCEVSFVVPKDIGSRPCEDVIEGENLDMVRSCNASGEKMEFDPILWEACRSLGVIFRNSVTLHFNSRRVQFFANPFCRICQSDNVITVKTRKCKLKEAFNYYFMINLSSLEKLGSPSRKSASCACRKFQILDPYTNKCRDVNCPEGYSISLNMTGSHRHFRCVDAGTKSNGFIYRLALKMTSEFSLKSNEFAVDITILAQMCSQLKWGIQSRLKLHFSSRKLALLSVFCYCHQTQNGTLELFLETDLANIKTVHTAQLVSDLMDSTRSMFLVRTLVHNSKMIIPLVSSVTQGLNKTAFDDRYTTGVLGSYFLVVDFQAGRSQGVYHDNIESVKNTLVCPYLVADETLDRDLRMNKILMDEDNRIVNDVLSLSYTKTRLVLDYTEFFLTREGKLIVCAEKFVDIWQNVENKGKFKKLDEDEEEANFTDGLYLSSTICLSFSCLCFLITLMTYILFPSLRTLPGLNTMSLVVTMFLTMVLVLFTPLIQTDTVLCQIVGVASHFFLLSSVTWMIICTLRAYSICTNLLSHAKGADNPSKLYLRYILVSLLIPGVVVTATILVNHYFDTDRRNINEENRFVTGNENINVTIGESQDGGDKSDCDVTSSSSLTPIGYGEGVCYISNRTSVLLAAGLPILLANLFNAVIFCLTILAIRRVTSDQSMVQRDSKKQLFIYVRLSALTGLNWIPGLLSSVVDSPVFFYAFNVLAGLQGLCVLVAFVLNERVLNMYKVKIFGLERESQVRDSLQRCPETERHP